MTFYQSQLLTLEYFLSIDVFSSIIYFGAHDIYYLRIHAYTCSYICIFLYTNKHIYVYVHTQAHIYIYVYK